MCVCVCAHVCVCDVLTALSVLERSYVVRSSNCCMYICPLRRGHVLRSGDCCVYVSVAARLCFALGV